MMSSNNYLIAQSIVIKSGELKTDTSITSLKLENNNEDDYLINGLFFTSAIAGSFLLDNTFRNGLKAKNENNIFLKIGHNYGEVYYNYLFAGTMLLSQFVSKNNKVAKTGKILFEALTVGSIATISLKFIFGKSRPYLGKGNMDFLWFETSNRKNSFPSGHVVTAFTTSTVLSKSINNTYASIVLYGLAGLTVYQRITSDNHWFSDTVLGASIGFLAGEYLSVWNERNEDNNYLLIPFFTKNNIALSFSFNL